MAACAAAAEVVADPAEVVGMGMDLVVVAVEEAGAMEVEMGSETAADGAAALVGLVEEERAAAEPTVVDAGQTGRYP